MLRWVHIKIRLQPGLWTEKDFREIDNFPQTVYGQAFPSYKCQDRLYLFMCKTDFTSGFEILIH